MPFHRKNAPSYLGGLPASHDYVNDPAANGDAGVPALDDGKFNQSGHPNDGTYFIPFGDDGTSRTGNRPHAALADNTDFLDDVVSGELPVPAELDATAAGVVNTHALSGLIFVGIQGQYADTQRFRDLLVKVLDASTGNDLVTSSGVKVQVEQIFDAGNSNNVVGVPASGFQNGVVLTFIPAIEAGTNYRLVYGKRSSLVTGIKDKTDLDLLVRLGIRAAQQVPAETLRFMREASRRAGSVQALAATILETPGLGDNILPEANELTVDIDPADSTSFNGQFNVRFSRDATAKELFSVLEGASGGESRWQNTAERVALSDVNTLASGFTETSVLLSEAGQGANNLRLMEQDPAAQGSSVVRRLNALWTTTIGNGTTTFGDFNGASAISDAIDFWNANPVGGGLRLLVKPGAYTVTDEQLTTAGDLVVEGTSRESVTLSNTGAGGTFGFRCFDATNRTLVLRNVEVSRGGTSNVAVETRRGYLVLEDVQLSNQGIQYNKTGSTFQGCAIWVSRCFINLDDTTAGTPLLFVDVVAGVSLLTGQMVFLDSFLSRAGTGGNAPVFLVNNATSGADAGLAAIHVLRSEVRLAGAALSSGSLVDEAGLFAVTASGTEVLTCRGLVLQDSYVISQTGVAPSSPCMHLRVPSECVVEKVAFIRTTLNFGTRDSLISPFIIAGAAYGDASPVREVVLEDTEIGFQATTHRVYGPPPTNFSAPTDFAGVFIKTARLRVRNLRLSQAHEQPALGDFYFLVQEEGDIEGLTALTWVTGTSSRPPWRVKLECAPGGSPLAKFHARGVHYRGPSSGDIVDTGVIFLTPNNQDLILERCVVAALTGANNGIILDPTSAAGVASGFSVIDCEVRDCAVAGFLAPVSGALATNHLERVTIRGCRFMDNDVGMILTGFTAGIAVQFSDVLIADNQVTGNDGVGMRLGAGTYAFGGATGQVSVLNNVVAGNNGSLSAVQIQVGVPGLTADGDGCNWLFQGNNCGRNTLLNWGAIYFASASPTGNGPQACAGIHNNVVTSAAAANFDEFTTLLRRTTSGADSRMILNVAQLEYDV